LTADLLPRFAAVDPKRTYSLARSDRGYSPRDERLAKFLSTKRLASTNSPLCNLTLIAQRTPSFQTRNEAELTLFSPPRLCERQSFKEISCGPTYVPVVETEPRFHSTTLVRPNPLSTVRMQVMGRQLFRGYVFTPGRCETVDGGVRDLDHEPASPFIKLERHQVDRGVGETAKMWEGPSETSTAQNGQYSFFQGSIHGATNVICHRRRIQNQSSSSCLRFWPMSGRWCGSVYGLVADRHGIAPAGCARLPQPRNKGQIVTFRVYAYLEFSCSVIAFQRPIMLASSPE
jgi:hypothetical protein